MGYLDLSPSVRSVPAKSVPVGTAEAIAESVSASAAGVLVVADETNGGTVYVGGPTVDIASGVQLGAGDSFLFRVTDPSLLYCVGSVASQKLRIVVL